ncbi:hypothetical protein ATANTOWER_000667 [Ataeniobius toweri]|uniref:Uncharacterized protein n=1 Tax=Ataeniobius toweri TaxID=208326 RepID=A0ABU7AEH4_9TELE|nr:hypothetical protein [Ataeniobius toweri]
MDSIVVLWYQISAADPGNVLVLAESTYKSLTFFYCQLPRSVLLSSRQLDLFSLRHHLFDCSYFFIFMFSSQPATAGMEETSCSGYHSSQKRRKGLRPMKKSGGE